MKNEYFGYTLFLALEREITDFIKTELNDEELWPEVILREAMERKASDPSSAISDRHFLDYLYFQQKLEGVARNRNGLVVLPKGASLIEAMPRLLGLNGLRNDTAHARGLAQDEFAALVQVCRDLVAGGFGGGAISEILDRFQDQMSGLHSPSANGPNVLHNLPPREYDDTGFVGRNGLIAEVVKALKSKSGLNNYLWLTGLGGFGKTAIAREVADRLYWDRDNPFEIIIWLSFKTHELTTEGPSQIRESVLGALDAFQDLSFLSGGDTASLADIFVELGHFNTLVVMDNCETYPGDMQEFVDADPPSSIKFLFTSRHNGEFGRTIPVPQLDLNECRHFVSKLNRTYESADISSLLRNESQFEQTLRLVGMAPLNLKWLVRTCNLGTSLETVLGNRDVLVRYCVENVYQQLESQAKRVLHCLQVARRPLSVGDLKVLMSELSADDLNAHVAALSKVGLIVKNSQGLRTVFVVDDTAREFLMLSDLLTDDDARELRRRRNAHFRKAKHKWSESPYSPYFVDGRDVEPLVCADLFRLLKPRSQWVDSYETVVQRALELIDSTPRFWEAYRVLSEIYYRLGETDRSIEYLERALAVCPSDREFSRSRLHFFLGLRLHETDDERASEEFGEALRLSRNFQTLLNYGRSLVYLGEFSQAEEILLEARTAVSQPQDAFFAEKALFDCYRRQGEGLYGNELLAAGLKAVKFWLSSTELLWDGPQKKKDAFTEDVVEAIVYICLGLTKSTDVSSGEREAVGDVLLRADSVFEKWGMENWPRLLESDKYSALKALASIVNRDARLRHSLVQKTDEAIRAAGMGGIGQVDGNLKVWLPEKGYGFMIARIGDKSCEAYFNRKSLKAPDDEVRLAFGQPLVHGVLHQGQDGRYYLLGVSVS